MPAPRYADAVRNGASPRKKDSPSLGTTSTPSMTTEPGTRPQKAVVRLPHDPRFIYPFAAATGRSVTVQVKSGVEFEGVLHGPVLGTKNIHITLTDAKKKVQKNPNGSSQAVKDEFYETLVIPSQEFVQMKATGVPFGNKDEIEPRESAAIAQFSKHQRIDGHSQTVSESSGSQVEIEEEVIPVRAEDDMAGFEGDTRKSVELDSKQAFGRDLIPWDGGQGGDDESIDLEELGTQELDSNWCQFDANKGIVDSTFSMDHYTTKLDVTKSKYTEEEAERLAREIEGPTRDQPTTSIFDDSGINEEDQNKRSGPTPTKPFSWADRVKGGKSQQQGFKATQPVVNYRKKESEDSIQKQYWNGDSESTEVVKTAPRTGLAPHQMDTSIQGYDHQGLSKVTENGWGTSVKTEPQQTGFEHQKQVDPVWSQNTVKQEVGWGENTVKQETAWAENTVKQEALCEESLPPAPSSPSAAALVVIRPEPKKPTSTVVPGISFKDKLKANLKAKPPQVSPAKSGPRPRGPTGQIQETQVNRKDKEDEKSVDPATDPVVQSPRGGGYAGKLITCPATNSIRHQERNLPPQDHLIPPGIPQEVPHHAPPLPMGPPPPHPMFFAHKPPPGMVPMMPLPGMQTNLPPPGYRDLAKEGPPRGVAFGAFGSPLDSTPPAHAGPPMTPTMTENVEEVAGAGRRAFQLNPMAKSYKPVVNLPPGGVPGPQNPDQPPPGAPRFNPVGMEAGPKAPMDSPVAPGNPSTPPVEGEKGPPGPNEFNSSQGGPQPPFIPPNVVTPWPSFPGTGVWHSGLGTPRPGTPGFIPPGMPGPYPVFMPGVSPFMGGMQDPMWRPPPPGHPSLHGMPDQQSLAMMWSNYYSQLVPPNKRMWNSAKGPPGAGPMPRPGGRHPRRPPHNVAGQSNVEMQ